MLDVIIHGHTVTHVCIQTRTHNPKTECLQRLNRRRHDKTIKMKQKKTRERNSESSEKVLKISTGVFNSPTIKLLTRFQ